MMPPDIVRRLNQGEKNFSLTIPSVSIMFIDVVQLSVYFTHLSPKQILGTLSDLWSSYNRKIGEYKYMNKIKLIGDIYMCAAVLYRNEPDPKADAIYSRNH